MKVVAWELRGKEGIEALREQVKEMNLAALETLLDGIRAEVEGLEIAVEAARLEGRPPEEIAKIMRTLSWVKAQEGIVAKEIARRMYLGHDRAP